MIPGIPPLFSLGISPTLAAEKVAKWDRVEERMGCPLALKEEKPRGSYGSAT